MCGLSLVGIGSFLEKQIFGGVDDGRTDGQMDGPMSGLTTLILTNLVRES